jgi:hypothetical protein
MPIPNNFDPKNDPTVSPLGDGLFAHQSYDTITVGVFAYDGVTVSDYVTFEYDTYLALKRFFERQLERHGISPKK